MATRRAIANGNWSATATWNGGVVPGNGDTVYANGFNVTLDTDVLIGGANNPIVNTGSLVSGQWYEIVNVGGQSWTGIGAASNTTGTVFLATGTGTAGNLGTARALATLTTATNTAAGATTGGGVFTMSTVRAMTADLRAGTTTCLNVTATTGTLTLSGLRVVGGSATAAHGLTTTASTQLTSSTLTGASGQASAFINNGAGTVTITDCVFTAGTIANSLALNNAGTGNINVTGSSTFTGGSNAQAALVNSSNTGTVTISASCTFTGGSTSSAAALSNNGTGTVNITSACTFTGGSAGPALSNIGTGTLIIASGTFTASGFANAVSIASSTADVRLSGDFLDHWSGWKAVSGGKWRLGVTPTAARTRYALAGTTDSYVEMFTADNATFGQPAISDVRSGTVYGGGILTGTCAVPAAGSVALGVPVDNTTGTAVLTPEAVWSATNRTITGGTVDTLTNAPASVTPSDIWSYNSRTITGGTVDTLTNAPTVPSASSIASQVRTELSVELGRVDQNISSRLAAADYTAPTAAPSVTAIRQEMDANSTKLANLDASISSRLADADYVAPTTPPTAAEIATAVESSILNEADGQQVLNAIVGAIGNQNLSEVSLVAAIRSDLERNGGKLDSIPTTAAPSASAVASATRTELSAELSRIDQSISSRLAASAYTAPANSDIASIKSKTDNLPASPAATGDIPSANITAIKAKTDLLNTDRLANVATTNIVGTLLAQANS